MNILLKTPKLLVFTAFVAVSSLLLAGCTNSEQSLNRYNELIREADQLYEQYEYSEAVSKYGEAADLVPAESDAFFGIVTILVDKGQMGQAAQIVEKSTGSLSSSDRSKLNAIVGNGYFEREDLENAEKYYLQANKGVENTPARVGLAQVYMKTGQLDKVKDLLNITDEKDPNFAQAAILRAYLKLEETKLAKEEVSDLTSVDMDDEVKAQYDSLLAAINAATDDKLYTAALLSQEYINAGYPYLAIKVLEGKKDDMAEYPDGLYFLGRAFFDHEKYGSAIDVLNEALSFDSYTSEVYELLAKSYYINGDQEKAFTSFEKAYTFASDANKEEVLVEYVDLLLSLEQNSKAQTFLAKGDEDSFEINVRQVELNYRKRDYDKMDFYIKKLAAMTLTDEQKKEYLNWLITYEIEDDKAASARENLDDLKEMDRYNPQYHLLLGKLELAENNTDEARDALESAIEFDLDGEVTEAAKKLLARID
jgi:tetratricopeptide (TPR) repeat protein